MLGEIILWLPPILLAITIHELAHGWVAYQQGDPTAEQVGRLTLNPIPHIDPIGLLALVFIHIGWAKPVPVNPNNFHNPRKSILLVSIAGPIANILLAIASAFLFRAIYFMAASPLPDVTRILVEILKFSVVINLILAFFNLIPIPPLDGSKIVFSLFDVSEEVQIQFSKVGPFLLLFVILGGRLTGLNILGSILFPPVDFFTNILIGAHIW